MSSPTTSVLAAALTAGAWCGAHVAAQDGATPAPAATPDTGSFALAGRWYTQGGCASRSGASATAPIVAQPAFAWRFEAKGALVGEPLVWDDFVVAEVHLGAESRMLQVLALADGAPVTQKAIRAAEPLAPALWNRELVVREGKVLRRYLFGKGGVSEQRTSKPAASQLGPPLRIGDDVFVVVDGGVERWNASDLARTWRCDGGGGFKGSIAVRGDAVFASCLLADSAALVEIDARTGKERSRGELPVQLLRGGMPEAIVGADQIVLQFGRALPMNGPSANSLLLPRPLPSDLDAVRILQMAAAPVFGERVWVGAGGAPDKPQLCLFATGKTSGVVLADASAHAEFAAAPASLAAGMLYLGNAGVDVESLQICWRVDAPAGARAVVARDTLLFGKDRQIVAFRDPLAATAAASAIDWDDVLRQSRRVLLQGLVADAQKGLELDFVDAMLARCRIEGVDEKWVADRARERKAAARTAPKKDPARLPALQARADGVDRDALQAVWNEVLAKAPAAAGAAHRGALQFVLGREPQHARATAAVRALLPEALRGTEPFDAREWLAWSVALQQVPVGFLDADSDPAKSGTQSADQLKLLQFRMTWRKDLVALQSQRLIVYTPVTAPGSIARCLSLGELVCTALEATFAGFPVQRKDPRRMRLCLYGSEAEYKSQSPGGGHLAWTSGHYSPREELSRMFVPNDVEAFARVMPVFAHELTHQWLEDRCPALHGTMLANRRPEHRGFWVVEGFAGFVEQFVFDLARRTHEADNPCDDNLDVVANARPGQLLPWPQVLATSQLAFQKISPVPSEDRKVVLGQQLGKLRLLSPRNCFYAQSGALCHWLWHADGGSRRRVLLEYVIAFYSGDAARLDLAATLGMTEDAIGAAVEAHAKTSRR